MHEEHKEKKSIDGRKQHSANNRKKKKLLSLCWRQRTFKKDRNPSLPSGCVQSTARNPSQKSTANTF